jgi:hypothetical protein
MRVRDGFFICQEMVVTTKEADNDCSIFQHINADEEGVVF